MQQAIFIRKYSNNPVDLDSLYTASDGTALVWRVFNQLTVT